MSVTTIKNGFAGGSDDQLKVNADGSINVTGPGGIHESGFNTLSVGPLQVSVGLSSTTVFAANPNRKYAHIMNNSGSTIFIQYLSPANLNQGIKIPPNTLYTIESNNLWLGSVNAVGMSNNQLIDILEGE